MSGFKSFTRFISLLLVIAFVIGGLPLTALAAEEKTVAEYNAEILEKKQSLEKKYGISITYPQSEGKKAGINLATLNNLDKSLEYVTPEITKQLSQFLLDTNGKKLTIKFSHSPHFLTPEPSPLASFTPATSVIELFSPRSSNKKYSSTGVAPTMIIHEIGHVYHEFLISKLGSAKLKNEWQSFNGSAKYASSKFNKNVFISEYGATTYNEDFAETFARMFVCDRAGYSIAKSLKSTSKGPGAIAQKVAYLENLIAKYSPNAETALKNIKAVYKTPEKTEYKDLLISGSSVEYIGFSEPMGIFNAIKANKLPFDVKSKKWDKTIGGWTVTATSGKKYLVFPGGLYTAL